jgi:hypothetical protein
MKAGKAFQIIDLGTFSAGTPKKEFSAKPVSYGKKLIGALLYSPTNENDGEKAYANLRLMANNRAQLVTSFSYPLQKDDPDDDTPRQFYPLDVEVKRGQLVQGYVELENPTRDVQIKLYLIFSR